MEFKIGNFSVDQGLKLVRRQRVPFNKFLCGLTLILLIGGLKLESAWAQTTGVLTVTGVDPYVTTSGTLHIADSDLSSTYWLDAGYHFFDLTKTTESDTERTNLVLVDISSSRSYTVPSGHSLYAIIGVQVTGYATNSGIVPIPIAAAGVASGATAPTACSSGGTCAITNPLARPDTYSSPPTNPILGATRYFAANFTSGSKLRIGFYPKDLCNAAVAITGGPLPTGCTSVSGVKPESGSSTTLTLTAYVGVSPSASSLPATDTTSDSKALNVQFHGGGPTLTCPSTSFYEPGDQSIRLLRNTFTPGAGAGGAPAQSLLVVASTEAVGLKVQSTDFKTNDVVSRLPVLATGAAESSGTTDNLVKTFTNSTVTAPTAYKVGVTTIDAAGVVLPITDPGSCVWTGLQTADIKGAITKGQCFVAGAAYREGTNPALRVLRAFRDQILSQFRLGRAFVRFYYREGPQWGVSLFEHPVLRLPILNLLLPLVLVAVISTTLGVNGSLGVLLLVLAGVAMGLIRASRRRKRPNSMLFVFALAQGTSATPYLDQLKSQLEPKPESSGYTESEKSRLNQNGSPTGTDGYTAGLKEKLGESAPQSGESYLEKTRSELAPVEETSAIGNALAGRSQLELKRPGHIRHGIGFHLGVWSQPTITSTGVAEGAPFSSIYQSVWNPEFRMTYEFKPLYNEWLGSLGFYAMGGISIFNGKGSFGFELPNAARSGGTFESTSTTEFVMYQLPVSAGLHYRMNLLYWLRPHVQAGPAVQFYSESRNDGKTGALGFSTALYYSLGLSILLDGLSDKSAWNLYAEAKVKHFYLTAEYVQFMNLGTAVAINSRGISAGFVFEF